MSFDQAQLKFFADYIESELGIIYSSSNYFQLEKRLSEISQGLSISEGDLYKKAQIGITGMFKQLLLDVATNNETSFFRDPKAFQSIENHILPSLRSSNAHLSTVRIWSAACSFGQEPYSLAMMESEIRKKDSGSLRFEIVATDISQTALNRAKEGRYSQLEVQRGLPVTLLTKYFLKEQDNSWILKSDIRSSVQFKKQNLLDSMQALGDFDIILCRNVLIYQKDDMKKEIIRRIFDQLKPGGFLILGAAESLIGLYKDYQQIHKDGAVYFQKTIPKVYKEAT